MNKYASRVMKSSAGYPMTAVWVAGVLSTIAVREKWVGLGSGIIIFTCASVLALVISIRREVHIVHLLVNNQRDELLNRITDLIEALTDAGVTIPEHRDHKPSEEVMNDVEQ